MTPAEIRALRARLGLSQAKFARLVGVEASAVAHWEQGHRNPSRPVLLHLQRLAAEAERKGQGEDK